MSFVLHYFKNSASHVVRMALEELGLPYRDELVDTASGAQRSESFLQLNPRGLVPVLIDERAGVALSETGAILLYVTEQSRKLAPRADDPAARATFLKWLFLLSNTIHADAQIQYYTARYVGADLAEQVRPTIHERMSAHFRMVEETIAGHGGPWLLGDVLSVCDFYLGGCVRWSLMAPREDPLDPAAVHDLPNLKALLEALEARDSVKRAFAAEGIGESSYFLAPGYIPMTTGQGK